MLIQNWKHSLLAHKLQPSFAELYLPHTMTTIKKNQSHSPLPSCSPMASLSASLGLPSKSYYIGNEFSHTFLVCVESSPSLSKWILCGWNCPCCSLWDSHRQRVRQPGVRNLGSLQDNSTESGIWERRWTLKKPETRILGWDDVGTGRCVKQDSQMKALRSKNCW